MQTANECHTNVNKYHTNANKYLALEDVSHSYMSGTSQEITALQNISLEIHKGEFVGIMGHTGCGKTTLIQLLAGLIAPTTGKVLLGGRDINERRYDRGELRRSVGVVFQYPEYQLFETTVEKDVAFGLKYSELSKKEIECRVEWALHAMGFHGKDIYKRSPLALSGGEKRRIAIAGVLAARPDILILDEPIAGLDPPAREEFLKLLKDLHHEGMTIIMISHNGDALGESADRLLIMDKGHIVRDGSVKEVYREQNFLKGLGLSPSTPSIVAEMLKEKGIIPNEDIVTYKELLSFLIKSVRT